MTPRSISVAGFSRTAISLAVILSSSLQAAPVLEEVVVTATLKAESLQDVPVSVNAVGGEKLFESGIGKVEDLAAYVPNLTMSETGIGTNIYIRGIGSGINQGFEQSVGMYFDGVSYGRAQLSRSPFMDLQRVEVLRGPQNILLGKPSIAGSLGLYSNRPDEEFEAMLSLSVEPEYDEYVYDGVISGKVSDNFGVRVAARVKTSDGYMENLTLDRNEPQRREETIRAVFDWAVSDNVTAWFKAEQSTFNVTGRQIEIINDNPAIGQSAASGFNGNTYGQILENSAPAGQQVSSDPSVLNNTQDYKRSSNGDFSKNDVGAYIANVEYNVNEHIFTSVTAFLTYEFDEVCDCDFTGSELFTLEAFEKYDQLSQEFRWISAPGDSFDFIGGFYFQTNEIEFTDQLAVPNGFTNLPNLVNASELAAIAAGQLTGLDNDGIPGNAGSTYVANLGAPREFTTDADLYSAFLQGTWTINDTMRLTLGGRYSYEKKSGSRKIDFVDYDTGVSRDEPAPGLGGGTDAVAGLVFLAERHDLSGSRSESTFSPSINFQWDVGDSMVYATLTRGFKSGGYDARSNASPDPDDNIGGVDVPPGSFEFDREQADSLEIGSKNSFFDGRWELNIAAFYTRYKDLQVSIFDGTLGFNVGNAGAATTMGIELDGRVAITDNLTMTYAAALLDFEFTDFEDGQCYQDRVNAGRFPTEDNNGAAAPDRIENGTAFCDYEGFTNQYAADFGGNVSFIYNKEVAQSLELRGNFDVVFTTDYNSSQNLDPSQEQDGYAKINARVAVAHLEDNWDFAIVGKNLTNETTISYSNDTPLANGNFGAVGHYGIVDSPRTIGFQITKRWY